MEPIAGSSPTRSPAPKAGASAAKGPQEAAVASARDAWLKQGAAALAPEEAWAKLQAAQLPKRPWYAFLPGQGAAHLRRATPVVVEAYRAYQSLRQASAADPLRGPSEARLTEAREKVEVLAGALAAQDPKGDRLGALGEALRGPQQALRLGLELPALPSRGNLDAPAWARTKAEWWDQQFQELAVGRAALEELSQGERTLGISLGSGGYARLLDEAEAEMRAKQAEGDLVGGVRALFQLGQILGEAYVQEGSKGRRRP